MKTVPQLVLSWDRFQTFLALFPLAFLALISLDKSGYPNETL